MDLNDAGRDTDGTARLGQTTMLRLPVLYCAVGCGGEIGVNDSVSPTAVVDSRPNKLHPIDHTAACPKGQATVQT